jgi:hypothetical protein
MDIEQWARDVADSGNPLNVPSSIRLARVGILEKSPARESEDTFVLEPANYPAGNSSGSRRRSSVGKGPSSFSCGSSEKENRPPQEDRYRRKPRRKTRSDLYEPRLDQRKETSRKPNEAAEKAKDDNRRRVRKTEAPNLRDARAACLGPGRLTVSSTFS